MTTLREKIEEILWPDSHSSMDHKGKCLQCRDMRQKVDAILALISKEQAPRDAKLAEARLKGEEIGYKKGLEFKSTVSDVMKSSAGTLKKLAFDEGFEKGEEEGRRKGLEEAANMIEGHRCDVSCGDPFMGKLFAEAIRSRLQGGEK